MVWRVVVWCGVVCCDAVYGVVCCGLSKSSIVTIESRVCTDSRKRLVRIISIDMEWPDMDDNMESYHTAKGHNNISTSGSNILTAMIRSSHSKAEC